MSQWFGDLTARGCGIIGPPAITQNPYSYKIDPEYNVAIYVYIGVDEGAKNIIGSEREESSQVPLQARKQYTCSGKLATQIKMIQGV